MISFVRKRTYCQLGVGMMLFSMSIAVWAAPTKAKPRSSSPIPTLGQKAPARALSLEDVLAIALRNNSSVALAQERLLKAQELIVQAEAQGKPQVQASLTDTLSSERTFGNSASGSSFTPSLPGGGTIPVVVDTGGGSTSSFVGGGGGGTTSSNGQSTTGVTGNTGTSGAGSSTLGTGTSGSGSGSSTTGGTGSGTSGTTGTGTSSSGYATSNAMVAALPAIVQEFAAASGVSSRSAATARPHDDTGTTTGGTGTGNPTTGGTVLTSGSNGKYNNYGGRLTVTQYLDIFHLVGTARDVETITRDFYSLDLDRVSNETALSVKNTFFDVLRAQTQVDVQQEQVRYATENVRIAQARYGAGFAAQFDVVSAQTTLSNAQQQLISAQNQLALSQANLNNLIGVSQDSPLTLQVPPIPAAVTPAIDQSLTTAYNRRPELRQADNNITIAQKLIKLAGATLKPSLALVGSAGYTGTSTSSSGRKDTYTLSAELGIPLYDGGTTKSRVRSAQVDLDTQLLTRSQLRQNVELEVRQAIISVNNAQAQIASATQGVTQAQEAVRLAQVRYQNGLGTFLEVTNAQAQLALARTNLATAEYATQTALAQLTRAEGGR